MGLRYSRRVGGNRGWGLNISGSGVSSSYRSRYGSVSARGFSIRTGIPGLTFRSSWGRGKNKGAGALIMLALLAVLAAAYLAAVVFYNGVRLLWWLVVELYHLSLRVYYKWKERRELKRRMLLQETRENIS